MIKIAVILAGCGMLDGSEVHETTCSLLAMKQNDCIYTCFSLDKNQSVVFDHSSKEEIKQERNMMAESARLSRLQISNLETLNVKDFDILYIPGGRGVVHNYSTMFKNNNNNNDNYQIDSTLNNVINQFFNEKKPICALCLAPIVVNKALENKNVMLTVGNDVALSKIIQNSNNSHIDTKSNDICVDEKNKILSSPCYMLTKEIDVVYNEAVKIIQKAIKLI